MRNRFKPLNALFDRGRALSARQVSFGVCPMSASGRVEQSVPKCVMCRFTFVSKHVPNTDR